jgi:hypothetical protein
VFKCTRAEKQMINSRRAEARSEAWRPHPILADISDDHPELKRVLRGIDKPAVPMGEIILTGPFGRTMTYLHAANYDDSGDDKDVPGGLLRTWVVHGRRYCFALDYAKYLLALKILGDKTPAFGSTEPDLAISDAAAISVAESRAGSLSAHSKRGGRVGRQQAAPAEAAALVSAPASEALASPDFSLSG